MASRHGRIWSGKRGCSEYDLMIRAMCELSASGARVIQLDGPDTIRSLLRSLHGSLIAAAAELMNNRRAISSDGQHFTTAD